MDNIHETMLTINKAKELIQLLRNLTQLIGSLPITLELQNQLLTIVTDIKTILQEAKLNK
mgnify:CR=1 FL=1